VFTGLVVRMYRFDVTACAEARRLVQRTESSLRELSVLFRNQIADHWQNNMYIYVYVNVYLNNLNFEIDCF